MARGLRKGVGVIRRVVGRRGRVAAGMVAALAVAFAAPSLAADGTAGGNNGTVKIHEGSTETEPIVRNEPHVCTFHLHFFFADPSQSGDWEIKAWSPGGSGDLILSGADDTAGDGEDRQPAAGAFSLADGHYKLFWQGRNEQNVKHKAFWVDCAAPAASPTGSEEPIDSASPSTSASPSGSASPTGSEEPASSDHGSPTGGVLPIEGTPQATPPATDVGGTSTGGSGVGLVVLALLLAAATALVTIPRDVLRRR